MRYTEGPDLTSETQVKSDSPRLGIQPKEAVYRKVLSVEPDHIKFCNLRIYLMHQAKVAEAKLILQKACIFDWSTGNYFGLKFYERAQEMFRRV